MPIHEHEVPVSVDLVRALVADQFPQWAERPVVRLEGAGTTNAIFRLGDDLAVRLPILPGEEAAVGAEIAKEAAAGQLLAEHLAFQMPVSLGIGRPGRGYPFPWALQTWVPGSVADGFGDSDAFVSDLVGLVRSLRALDVGERTHRGGTVGGALRVHDPWVDVCLDKSESLLDVASMRRLWAQFRALPRESPDLMTHGDLIPANLVVRDGRLVGVLDPGMLGPADPALDLIVAWHALTDDARGRFRREIDCSDLEWERGKAWAFEQSVGLVCYFANSNPAMRELGRRTLQRIAASTNV